MNISNIDETLFLKRKKSSVWVELDTIPSVDQWQRQPSDYYQPAIHQPIWSTIKQKGLLHSKKTSNFKSCYSTWSNTYKVSLPIRFWMGMYLYYLRWLSHQVWVGLSTWKILWKWKLAGVFNEVWHILWLKSYFQRRQKWAFWIFDI